MNTHRSLRELTIWAALAFAGGSIAGWSGGAAEVQSSVLILMLAAFALSARFHRTHRSALVRLDLIRELRADSPYSYSAILTTGARVPVSRERFKGVEAALTRGVRASATTAKGD